MNKLLNQQLNAFSQAVRLFKAPENSEFNIEKLSIYQYQVLNNAIEIISPCFPILSSIMGIESWRALILAFLKTSQLLTPIYHELPYELVKYLQKAQLTKYPFAADLSHYEWLELELEFIDAESNAHFDNHLLLTTWRLSNSARLVAYEYDVHNINKNYQPLEKLISHYIVYKNMDRIEFITLAPNSYQLLECILKQEQSPMQTIENLCQLYPDLNPAQLQSQSQELIELLYHENIIILSS